MSFFFINHIWDLANDNKQVFNCKHLSIKVKLHPVVLNGIELNRFGM